MSTRSTLSNQTNQNLNIQIYANEVSDEIMKLPKRKSTKIRQNSNSKFVAGERSVRSAETPDVQQSGPAAAQSGDPAQRHRVHRVAGGDAGRVT